MYLYLGDVIFISWDVESFLSFKRPYDMARTLRQEKKKEERKMFVDIILYD